MDKRYDEIMDKIQVTDEMRERILSNLQIFGFEKNPVAKGKKRLSIAVCFTVLIIAMFLMPVFCDFLFIGGTGPYSGEENREVSSLNELSSAVNFVMNEVEYLPFVPEERFYDIVEEDTAQITYVGNGERAVFRKSAGNEDNSGDFAEYSEIREIEVETIRATLKGDSGSFLLAVWSAGDFSYSLQVSDGLSVAEWQALMEEIVAEKP